MKVLLLYRPKSEHARTVEEFVREFERRDASRKIEVVDIDSRDGTAMASLYDIMDQPAILVLADDGQLLQMWVGSQLPLMDEVAAYSISGTTFSVAPQQ
jgi:hypothetical protein